MYLMNKCVKCGGEDVTVRTKEQGFICSCRTCGHNRNMKPMKTIFGAVRIWNGWKPSDGDADIE